MPHEYRISEEDYVAALRLACARSTWRRLFPYVMIVVAAVLSVSTFGNPDERILFLVSTVVAIGLTGLEILSAILIPRRMRNIYRKDKAQQQPLRIEMNDAGLALSSSLHDVKVPWDHLVKWRENASYILVFSTPVMFQIIPKRLADTGFDIERLRERLTEQVGPAT
jgi:hypothetical protein